MDKKNILVSGGVGYLGSTLVGHLLSLGYNVVAIDSLLFGGESLLGILGHPNFRFIRVDIAETDAVNTILDDYKIQAVVHLAAIVGDPACAKQPDLARKVNYEASVNLLDLSIIYKIERFIFTSTCSNYGKMSDPN